MIIAGGKLITNDKDNNFYKNGAVVIEDNIIKDAASYDEIIKKYPDEEVVDVKGKLIMPGLICAHSHIYSTYARGMSVSKPTDNFIHVLENQWWALDKSLTLEDVKLNGLVTYMESVTNGVTTLIDHHAGPNAIEGSLFTLADAAKDVGIRTSLCYEVSDRDGLEKRDLGIAENINWIKESLKRDDMASGLFGIHASFTVSDETLEKSRQAMEGLYDGYHVHIAEGLDDQWITLEKYGKRVVERLEGFDIFSRNTLAVHNVHINPLEISILKHHDTMAVFNPESNMNNAVGAPPVLDFLDKGLLVGLGTDAYTNDMFESMKVANILMSHESADPTKGFSETLHLQFKNNPLIMERYLKRPVGRIESGAYADIILLDYDPVTPLNANNWGGHVLFGLSGKCVSDTIINGKFVMKDREILGVDRALIHAKSRERAKEIWKNL